MSRRAAGHTLDSDTVTLRVAGPVDELAAEMADRAGSAVHPYEVAALLESEGLTGEQIRERYGHPDLFSLAEDLYRRVPRSFPDPPVGADAWAPDHVRCMLRGVLFALPGLAYLLVAPLLRGTGAVPGLVVAGLVSWAWGQGLGHRTYVRLNAGRREAGLVLLTGAPLGAALATGSALAVAGAHPVVLWAALAQSVYLAAAGVLLVLGRERSLLAVLAPLAGGAAALPWWEPGPLLRIALVLATVAAAAAVAAFVVAGALRADPAGDGPRVPYLPSLPYGLFGLAAGVLVLTAGAGHPLAVVALTVSMGPAEWLLYRFRGLSVAALRASTTVRGFVLRTVRTLALCLGLYLVPLIPAALLTGADPVGLVALAAVLWIALLLQAFGTAWPTAAICLPAAAAIAAATAGPAWSSGEGITLGGSPWPWAWLVCTGAAALLAAVAVRLLGRPSAHV
ncbi:hypothetical protein [Streptomyces sp. NPDC046887]|uniref:hypothetical protein n=1 Tax=Streptomyces sp. NPDC046887 TaxID=3155472 RepID=UPI0033FA9B21